MGGWSNIETALKYYLKSSDENEKKAVRILDELMEVVSVENVAGSGAEIPTTPTSKELPMDCKGSSHRRWIAAGG